ncbi:hypothetical protein PVK06_001744 [Gossypium arboreum]|uniref:RNase H type-1 domain-containing protein n=1 Tax=Gossypium arboreum TaxID=29729 RepID=A0ABR0R2T4_GOSAR|nr:hypothetical protein PVK06_001744 [Gossypium arboreum]
MWEKGSVERGGENINPILGFSLEGRLSAFDKSKGSIEMDHSQNAMEYDLEEGVIIGEEGKKRSRGEIEESSSRDGYEVSQQGPRGILHNNVPSPFAAKTYAGLEAIRLEILLDFRELQIRGDSMTVIRKCQTTETDKSVIESIIRDIQKRCIHFQTIEFKHIPRSDNIRAHQIAKEALESGVTSYLVQGEPNLHDSPSEGRWARDPD